MRTFVTGATGRVGRRLVTALLEDGHEVVGLTRSSERAQQLSQRGAEAVVGSLADQGAVELGLDGAEVVYHLAGGLRGKGQQDAAFLNQEGTQHLVELSGETPIIMASTSAVYGDRSGLWVDETHPVSPNTAFGTSKAAAEELVLQQNGRVARLGMIYGRGFGVLLEKAMVQGTARLPGEGRNFIPVIHVDDAVGALRHLAENAEPGTVVNCADTDPRPLMAFYAQIHAHVGGSPVRFWSTWVPGRLQHRLAALNEVAKARLGRTPHVTPDHLRLFTASVRMKTKRLQDLGYTLQYPTIDEGLAEVFDQPGKAG